MLSSGSLVILNCLRGITMVMALRIRRIDFAISFGSRAKQGLFKTSSYSLRRGSEAKQRKNRENARSRIILGGPSKFRWAETTTFVSRAALSILAAAIAAISLNFQVYGAHRDRSYFLRCLPNPFEYAGRSSEIFQILFDTHNDGLRLTTAVYYKSLVI